MTMTVDLTWIAGLWWGALGVVVAFVLAARPRRRR